MSGDKDRRIVALLQELDATYPPNDPQRRLVDALIELAELTGMPVRDVEMTTWERDALVEEVVQEHRPDPSEDWKNGG